MEIDRVTYNKAKLLPSDGNFGYGPGQRSVNTIKSIIIHTTNGKIGTRFEAEADFLYRSRDVSAHYLVGKEGQIVCFLDPSWIAWHAGAVNKDIYSNRNSIGIECHLTPGEKWTDKQKNALTELVKYLLSTYTAIIDIATHRSVAVPVGRKIDPSEWSDENFTIWKQSLLKKDTALLLNEATATKEQCVRYILSRPSKGEYTDYDISLIVGYYFKYGAEVGIDPALAIAQCVHETGNFSSWWAARPRRNPAGLGVTGESSKQEQNKEVWAKKGDIWLKGYSFNSWEESTMAHLGHLLSYCLKDTEMNQTQYEMSLKSPRKTAIPLSYRGNCKVITDLNGKWAVPGTNYGQSITKIWENIKNS